MEAFLEVVDRRSIQAASRASGRSRATYGRYLKELRVAFDAPELLRRAPGQREGVVTREGETLAAQARLMLRRWDQWLAQTRDGIQISRRSLRVGALAGAFDLIADLLSELRESDPDLPLRMLECDEARLLEAVASGEVDLGFGHVPEIVPKHLHLEALGPLEWVLVIPSKDSDRFEAEIELADLDGVPMILGESGPARARIEHEFRENALALNAAFVVGSTPRIVEMVARGFGVAIVSRFRTAFLPQGATVRPLVSGPAPLTAAVLTRAGVSLSETSATLIERARERFFKLSRNR